MMNKEDNYLPKGIGKTLRVSEMKPGQLVAIKKPGEAYTVVEVKEIHRFAVIFTALSDKLIVQRTGDNLDALTMDSINELPVFAYSAA